MDIQTTAKEQLLILTRLGELRDKFVKEGSRRKTRGTAFHEDCLSTLKDLWKRFKHNDSELESHASDGHEYFLSETFEKGKEKFDELRKKIEEAKVTDFAPQKLPLPQPGLSTDLPALPTDGGQRDSNQTNDDPSRTMTDQEFRAHLQRILREDNSEDEGWRSTRNLPKLPPVKLQVFTGKENAWPPFINLFLSAFDNNPSLSGIQKMQYLTSHLDGQPRDMIAHLSLTNANYQSALTILRERYENKRHIVMTYMNSIVQHKKLASGAADDVIKLHDCFYACLAGLQNLGYDVSTWHPMLVSIAIMKFDADTNKAFEESIHDVTAVPTVQELLTFLLRRYRILHRAPKETQGAKDQRNAPSKNRSFHVAIDKTSCSKCHKDHPLAKCFIFKKMSPQDRKEHAKEQNLCFNCLSHPKSVECKSKNSCFTCRKKHHTLLHMDQKASTSNPKKEETTKASNLAQAEDTVALHTKTATVVLPTALLRIRSREGEWLLFRALLDTGSGDTFISEDAAQMLNLPRQRIVINIKGIGDVNAGKCKTSVDIIIAPRMTSDNKWYSKALVMPKLTSFLPSKAIESKFSLHRTHKLTLADPKFDQPGKIDLIIGTNIYAQIMKTNLKRDDNGLIAQDTKLGWVVLGTTLNPGTSNEVISMVSVAEIDRSLRKFYEMDVDNDTIAEQEQECQTHYTQTHARGEDGRYQVRLPFKTDDQLQLGESRNQALARFLSMEKKMARDPELKKSYTEFMNEYQELGHMTIMPNHNGAPQTVYYLPHHAVFKAESTTTKVRVVFDASAKTNTGYSLNNMLHSGPKLQQDLTSIITRWRKYIYVYTADIEKMFRQIELHPDDRDFHRILWRASPRDKICEFQLNTVTYGTAPATYLSVRTLLQLANDEGHKFPRAAKVLREDLYVDDMLTGAHSLEEAKSLHKEIIALMALGRFNLRKWTSNSNELLTAIPEHLREKGIIQLKEDDTITPLGIHLNPTTDYFQFTIKMREKEVLSKRGIVSETASIFDPIGWLAPVILQAKMIIQLLWKEEIGWDDTPSEMIIKRWKKFRQEIFGIEDLRIPRWIGYNPQATVEIHGFADASEKAYAACVYVRVSHNDTVQVHLLTAKTRVAPLKGTVTLPRLELCGAVMLAQLMATTIQALDMEISEVHAWTDSEITLAWIAKDPSTWHTYIANRVTKIHKHFSREIWAHVSSEDNPADIASRGCSATVLKKCKLWLRGPSWLIQPHHNWPKYNRNETLELYEKELFRTTDCLFTLGAMSSEDHVEEAVRSVAPPPDKTEVFLNKFSTFRKVIFVIAFLLRFMTNFKRNVDNKVKGELTVNEINNAKLHIFQMIQQLYFPDEMKALKNKKPLPNKSKIKDLHPFLDNGVMRVGGRLQNSNLPAHTKNPILLPKCHTTDTIIREAHLAMLHAGPQLTLNHLRSRYWVHKGLRYVKMVLRTCVRCAKCKPIFNTQLMGSFPSSRVTEAPPFTRCGVDFAGPITTRRNKGRGNINEKSYIAVFICFVTRAIHLEAVSDLSTETFLAALRRFMARRGKPATITSDNGTNFVGAKRILDKQVAQAIKDGTSAAIPRLAQEGIEWKFIPPGAPHFGGLWEAAVKSVKHHLIRVIGLNKLTFEELSTLLAEIEACVNSRPMTPIPDDPTGMEALTPSHFLLGRATTWPPEPAVADGDLSNKWKQIIKLRRHFWNRWSQEFLTSLQQRTKWHDEKSAPKIGELVLLKDDTSSSLRWPLARITGLQPGNDGLVRVATIRLKGNKVKQAPIHKLAQLPIKLENKDVIQEPRSTDNEAPSEERIEDTETTRPTGAIPKRPITRAMTRTACLTVLYFFTLLTMVLGENYTLTTPKQGLFIENLGEVHLSRGRLRMDLTFSRKSLEHERNQTLAIWNQTKILCQEIKILHSNTQCHILTQHLDQEKGSLENQLSEISSLTQLSRHRKKRGLFSSLIKYVFGNGEDDLYTHLDALGHNHNALLQTMNQQTLLLNTRISQSNQITEQKLKLFNERASQLQIAVKEMQAWHVATDRNRLEIQMLTTYLGAMGYIQELQKKYEAILRVFMNKATSIELLTKTQIDEQIKIAHKKLGASLMISRLLQRPVTFTSDTDSIFVYVYFNIIETNSYEMMHVTPVPQHVHNDTFAIQDIKDSMLGVDFHNQRYFTMRDTNLQKCQSLQSYRYICEVDLIYELAEHPSCVIDEIFNRHKGVKCPVRKVNLSETMWKGLNTENTWLFITGKPFSAAIMCGGFRQEILLNSTGILHVKRSCFIKTKLLTLRTSSATVLQAREMYSHTIIFPEVNTTLFKEKTPILLDSAVISHSEDIFSKVAAPVPSVIPMMIRATPKHTPYTISGVIGSVVLLIILWKTKACWWTPICSRKIIKGTTGDQQEADQSTTSNVPFAHRLQLILGRSEETQDTSAGRQDVPDEEHF